MSEYVGLGFFILLGSGVVVLFLLGATLLGPKLRFAEKDEPFECGEHQIHSPYQRFNVKFYMIAVSFIIFDVEVVFLYPWAVAFRELGWYGLFAMTPFLGVIAIALAYEWMKGGLEWD